VQRRHQYLVARLAYVGIVLLATLTQLDFSGDLAAAAVRLSRAFTPSLGWRDAIDGVRNLALFGGLGAVWVVTSFSGNVRQAIARATLVGALLSVTVEGLQVFSPIRTASIVDVTTNTLGTLGGAVLVAALIAHVVRARGGRSYLGLPAFVPAGCYLLAVVCEALTPLFRSEPMKGIYGGPLTRLHAMMALALPLSFDATPLGDVFLYAPAGWLAVMWLAEAGGKTERSWREVAAYGAIAAMALELGHGVLAVTIRWEAAAVHALSITFGAWAAWRWLPAVTKTLRGARRAGAMFLTYAILLVIWGWRPFYPRIDPAAIAEQVALPNLIPLEFLASRADVFSALHVAQQFLLYLPLGALLAVWPLRSAGRWSGLKPVLWLAAGVELGHIFIDQRLFDVTNALIAVAGASIGWVVLRRSTYPVYGEAWPPPRRG
jgi:glycopeptide antibiotics resistance protein